MPTPTNPERRLLAIAATKGSAWGTAVALPAASGMLINSLSGFTFARDYDPADEADTPVIRSGSLTQVKPVDFTLGFDCRYDPGALGMLIALLFGTAGTPTTLVTGAYKHTFQWADSGYGKFATVVAEYPSKIYEVPSAKPTEFSLKVNKGIMAGDLKLRGNTLIETSTTNTATQMDALTYADRHNRILFGQGSVKMIAESGADPAGATALEVSSLDVSYKRVGHDAAYGAGAYTIIEPVEGGKPDFRVKLGFPRMNSINNANLAAFIAEATQKMVIKFTGAICATTYAYDLALFFPRFKIVHPEYTWAEIVSAGLELVAEEAAAISTGILYTRPYIELQNARATDYLT
jgi:hypothetical protein